MTKTEIEKRMNEIQQELNSLKAQLNEPEKKTGWEKPDFGGQYYYVGNDVSAHGSTWTNHQLDTCRYNNANCFTSEELAENIARYQSLDLRIRRRIAEICEPIQWGDCRRKWHFVWSHNTNLMIIDWSDSVIEYATWNFDTREQAEQIMGEFKDDLLWYFTEFKDRMDG